MNIPSKAGCSPDINWIIFLQFILPALLVAKIEGQWIGQGLFSSKDIENFKRSAQLNKASAVNLINQARSTLNAATHA